MSNFKLENAVKALIQDFDTAMEIEGPTKVYLRLALTSHINSLRNLLSRAVSKEPDMRCNGGHCYQCCSQDCTCSCHHDSVTNCACIPFYVVNGVCQLCNEVSK
jgi:hypothetical protein